MSSAHEPDAIAIASFLLITDLIDVLSAKGVITDDEKLGIFRQAIRSNAANKSRLKLQIDAVLRQIEPRVA